MVERTSVAKKSVGRKRARQPLNALRPERFRILVDDAPASLDRRIAGWCKASWGWLISAAIHAVVTLLLMMCTTSPEVIEPQLFHFSSAHDFELESAPPTKLEQMNLSPPEARDPAIPVGDSVSTKAFSTLAAIAGRLEVHGYHSGGGLDSRHSGPTDSARQVAHHDAELPADASQGTEFFGIKATGKRFVFVVDSSRSMRWSKWRRACRELVDSIERLGPDQSFCVFFFDSVPHLMFNQRPAELRLIEASPRNVIRVRRWMATVSFGHQTRPFAAVRHAMAMRPDAVFLLSDGEFHDATLAYFQPAETSPAEHRVIVHTIGFKSRQGQATLRQIADWTGGTYRFVP